MGLYAGLQAFFRAHPALQRRPFFVAGESYAGKFVPSLGTLPVATTLGCWKVIRVAVFFCLLEHVTWERHPFFAAVISSC